MIGSVTLRLRDVRVSKFMTQDELAQRARLSRQSVNRIENGQPARLTTTRRLAEALRVKPETLVIA